ncbi:MAG: ABC transporter permease [Candidatus Marinimicrobia bacterium]|nr:ABC transporter permease [Candidatus Neomarinimicrobiota bacterium]MBL7009964.1 ABC transporter permease [Candidatus Neomarinimicrobiota bacterium]MBL7029737.1 ABC transporter permease [Candidatus Neomarinimicrobiota bacterium]
MNFPFYLSTRYLRSTQKGSFTRIAGVLSVAGLAVGISALLITLFILNGFERVISEKIADFDGHIRIRHYLNNPIPSNIKELDQFISVYNEEVVQSKFIQGPALLRKGKSAEGVIVEGLEHTGVDFIKKILVSGSIDLDNRGLIIGERLANQLNIDIGDKTVLFDLATLRGAKKRLKQFTVTGIFHSGMSEYDQSLVYTNLKLADGLFNLEGNVSGHILRLNDSALVNDFSQLLGEELAYPYMVMTWKEKNRALFKWMDVQRWPILFIFSLIALVGIVNIISALAMIVLDKTRQIGILRSLGMTQSKLKQVFLAKGFIIGVAGGVFGSALALLLAWLQNTFKLITVPEDVYFMDFIPLDVNLAHVGIVTIISAIFAVIAAIWPTIRAGNIQPAKALNYE